MTRTRLPIGILGISLLVVHRGLAAEEGTLVRETWDAAYVGEDKIGHFHAQTHKVQSGGREVLHTRLTGQLAIQRFGDVMRMRTVADYYELPDGRLYATNLSAQISNEASNAQGRLVAGGKFQVTITPAKGSKIEQTLDWPVGLLGPFGQEESLRKSPLKAGQTREFLTFLPEMNLVAKRTLHGVRLEPIALLNGESVERLLVTETNDQVPVESSLWMDEAGNIVKSLLPIADLSMTTYRVTKEEALLASRPATVDVGLQTLIKPDNPATGAHTARSASYLLEFGDKAAADSIPEAGYQKILSRDGNNLVVRIERTMPDPKVPGTAPAPGPEFLDSNVYLQPNDPKILATAREVTREATSDWEKATCLETWVDENMANQDFTIGFAPSNEIIESKQGDCTEHAVLLAALCRAVGIPSKVAMGLVWLEGPKAFGYHMWTEVFVDGDWHPIDGTLGFGSIGGGHIKIADGSLKGVDANTTFLPIFKVIGKLKIKVLKVDNG